jgi:hypothetical protein
MIDFSIIWKPFNDFYDSDRILEQPFFQIIGLSLHPFSTNHSMFDVGRSMFIFFNNRFTIPTGLWTPAGAPPSGKGAGALHFLTIPAD